MKTIFSLVNFFVGVMLVLVGVAIFLDVSRNPASAGAGVVTVAMGAVCLWLARKFVSGKSSHMNGTYLPPTGI
jgi:FtsH-binding integral membrane protein